MAKKRRTRKQKTSARHLFTYSLPKTKAATTKAIPSQRKTLLRSQKPKQPLFYYDPQLIRADLTKTLALSILATGAILAIYFFNLI